MQAGAKGWLYSVFQFVSVSVRQGLGFSVPVLPEKLKTEELKR